MARCLMVLGGVIMFHGYLMLDYVVQGCQMGMCGSVSQCKLFDDFKY